MTTTSEATPTLVASPDGTDIAYWTSGQGPPLVLVHGIAGDRARWAPLTPHLESHVTVHAVDRRGRGASGDAPDYALARECEDVAAVVDAVAEASGGAVDLLGHSFGALCALGAASQTPNVRRLVLYEPPGPRDHDALPAGFLARLDRLVAAGEREAVIEAVFGDLLGMHGEEIATFRARPSWQARVEAAHTIPRELRAEVRDIVDATRLAAVGAPTLMLGGEHSAEHVKADTATIAAALPDARVVVLAGQEHLADVLDPEGFAVQVLAFLRDGR